MIQRTLSFAIFMLSFSYANIGWNVITKNLGYINNASIRTVYPDSVEIISNEIIILLSIDNIVELRFERPLARLLVTTLGVYIGGATGGIIGIKTMEDDGIDNIYKFIKEFRNRLYISTILGSITFGYLGYRFTGDISYSFQEISHTEKIDILNKLKT
ncbi:MAG: hypothetical protein GWP19_15200 [Planctomycetia bacterium]|nr:hypothetical protein [Planctomycetia bacterium]